MSLFFLKIQSELFREEHFSIVSEIQQGKIYTNKLCMIIILNCSVKLRFFFFEYPTMLGRSQCHNKISIKLFGQLLTKLVYCLARNNQN